MKTAYLREPQPIKVTIEGGFHEKNALQLTLSADATIEDWIETFKTILVHQTFTLDAVKELFEEPFELNCEESIIPTSQSIWKDEF